ncbi:MAG: glycosyl transferase, group 1 [Ignavibacteria bacterium]|nr:glycosyl transferase, group 1 [Ignavibacteria bacterium]
MKNLLVIAYYFPPSGGPGVQRVLKHIKYLPEFGWNPVVLTVSNGQFPARDESLLSQIPENIIVVRTKIYEPYSLYRKFTGKKSSTPIDVNVIKKEGQKRSTKEKISELIRGTFFIPDARIGWLPTAKEAALDIIRKHNINAIYSSSPPYTCSLIARAAKRRTGLPWIAGFRDPWTEFLTTPNRWLIPQLIDKHLERSVFSEATSIECAWEGITKDALRKYPELDAKKFHHVPNGFDSSDFPKAEYKPNQKFTVTYTGSMYGRRNPQSFFEAIEKLLLAGKIKADEVCLRFIGRFGAEVEEMFAKASFLDSIEIISYLPHDESLRYLMQSDCLLLVVDEAKESREIVPGKVYEYVGVRRPIIAVAPRESAIAELMLETGSGMVAHQSEIDAIADIFLKYYQNWKEGNNNFAPDQSKINKYERREAAGSLAGILDTIV